MPQDIKTLFDNVRDVIGVDEVTTQRWKHGKCIMLLCFDLVLVYIAIVVTPIRDFLVFHVHSIMLQVMSEKWQKHIGFV